MVVVCWVGPFGGTGVVTSKLVRVEVAKGAVMNQSLTNAVRFVSKFLTLAMIALAATGCASIIKGSDQSVTFKSEPPEAKLTITDVREGKDIHVGTTPTTTSLKRGAGYFSKSKYKVTIEKPGYRKEEVMLEGTPGGWYLAGNLLFGALIGWFIVDPATGAMWTLDPDEVNVTLKKEESFLPRGEGLTIVLRNSVPAELEGKMKLVRAPLQH